MKHRLATGDGDTAVIDIRGPRNMPLQETPALRRITGLSVSFVGFLGSLFLMGWWAWDNAKPGSQTPVGQSAFVFVLFVLASAALGVALFRDFADRRARATEKLFRDLLFFEAEEIMVKVDANVQAAHEQTARRVQAMLAEVVDDVHHNQRQARAVHAAMHQQILDRIGVVVDAKMSAVMEEHDHILEGLLLLEKVMPELLAQTEWVAYAKGIRAGLENEVPVGPDAPVRFPQAQPMRRRPGAQLRAVPESSSN